MLHPQPDHEANFSWSEEPVAASYSVDGKIQLGTLD